MSEENKTAELKEEELEKVYGGGSGTIPSGGIQFARTYWLSEGCYYSSAENTDDVVYVYSNTPGGELWYTNESFSCTGGIWNSTRIAGPKHIENDSEFLAKYPYIMNVRP